MNRLADPAGERGSGPVEFVLVGGLLTALVLAVIQLGVGIYVRNVVHDAAVEGAHHAALADTTPAAGARLTAELIGRAVGDEHAGDVDVALDRSLGVESVTVTVRTTLPLAGLAGIPRGMEVTGRAPLESLG